MPCAIALLDGERFAPPRDREEEEDPRRPPSAAAAVGGLAGAAELENPTSTDGGEEDVLLPPPAEAVAAADWDEVEDDRDEESVPSSTTALELPLPPLPAAAFSMEKGFVGHRKSATTFITSTGPNRYASRSVWNGMPASYMRAMMRNTELPLSKDPLRTEMASPLFLGKRFATL